MTKSTAFDRLNRRIVTCERCPRLIEHCRDTARTKRASYRDDTYHGKPVPNFGGPAARLLIVGLAPGAHGANRTGRMFTGDRSGDFLFKVMHRAGFANQPTGTHRGDGLELIDAAITAACHCAPPGNKPTAEELANCRDHFVDTFDALPRVKVALCLGKIAFDALIKHYQATGVIEKRSPYQFAHAAEYELPGAPTVLCAYHPSQQNTFTGRLTEDMLLAVFRRAATLIQAS